MKNKHQPPCSSCFILQGSGSSCFILQGSGSSCFILQGSGSSCFILAGVWFPPVYLFCRVWFPCFISAGFGFLLFLFAGFFWFLMFILQGYWFTPASLAPLFVNKHHQFTAATSVQMIFIQIFLLASNLTTVRMRILQRFTEPYTKLNFYIYRNMF